MWPEGWTPECLTKSSLINFILVSKKDLSRAICSLTRSLASLSSSRSLFLLSAASRRSWSCRCSCSRCKSLPNCRRSISLLFSFSFSSKAFFSCFIAIKARALHRDTCRSILSHKRTKSPLVIHDVPHSYKHLQWSGKTTRSYQIKSNRVVAKCTFHLSTFSSLLMFAAFLSSETSDKTSPACCSRSNQWPIQTACHKRDDINTF